MRLKSQKAYIGRSIAANLNLARRDLSNGMSRVWSAMIPVGDVATCNNVIRTPSVFQEMLGQRSHSAVLANESAYLY
jgi:hypothetical protein